jgi:hypothetical protein
MSLRRWASLWLFWLQDIQIHNLFLLTRRHWNSFCLSYPSIVIRRWSWGTYWVSQSISKIGNVWRWGIVICECAYFFRLDYQRMFTDFLNRYFLT